MPSTWRLQVIKDNLLLQLINYHHLTIDDLVERHLVSKTRLYEHFRDVFRTTPGAWRKRYWRGCHWAARFYYNAFELTVCHEFQDQRIDDTCYIDPILDDEDTPMTWDVIRVKATIEGRVHDFRTNRPIYVGQWEDIHSSDNKFTLSIRLSRGGRHPVVTAYLSLGGHLSGQISKSYDLDVTVRTHMVGYDVNQLKPAPVELALPKPIGMKLVDTGAEFDLNLRSVYLLKLGPQTLILGLYEGLDETDVNRLHPQWTMTPLNNALRRKLRTAFHTSEYVEVTMRTAIEMQKRVGAVMDQMVGVPVCFFKKNDRNYLVKFDGDSDLTLLTKLYPYMESSPTRIAESAIPTLANRYQAKVIHLNDLS